MSLRFLHASDIHLLDLAGVGLSRFFNKRATGGLNLWLGRSKKHDADRFDAMMDTAARLNVDRIVLTGDLTNLALEPEFALVRDKLAALPVPVTVIPGNHDTYTRGSVRAGRFERYLGPFMEGDRLGEAAYPFVQRFGDVALVGVSSAVATLPLFATGRVGADQLERLAHVLRSLRGEGVARIVLIHHPVLPGVSKARHDLLDLDAFGQVLAREGAELVLHGHEHRVVQGTLVGPDGQPIPVHGVSSGTARAARLPYAATFSLYDAGRERLEHELYAWEGGDFRPAPAPQHTDAA